MNVKIAKTLVAYVILSFQYITWIAKTYIMSDMDSKNLYYMDWSGGHKHGPNEVRPRYPDWLYTRILMMDLFDPTHIYTSILINFHRMRVLVSICSVITQLDV